MLHPSLLEGGLTLLEICFLATKATRSELELQRDALVRGQMPPSSGDRACDRILHDLVALSGREMGQVMVQRRLWQREAANVELTSGSGSDHLRSLQCLSAARRPNMKLAKTRSQRLRHLAGVVRCCDIGREARIEFDVQRRVSYPAAVAGSSSECSGANGSY